MISAVILFKKLFVSALFLINLGIIYQIYVFIILVGLVYNLAYF